MSARRLLLAAVFAAAAATSATGQSRRALAELGRIDPPAYAPPLQRLGEPSAVFDEAIDAYQGRRYARAADVFRRFVTVEPDDPAGNFFLAVCLMMTDDVGEAEDRLGVVIGAGPRTFELPSRFVRGKALIRLGRLDEAEAELSKVATSTDAYARSAAELLPKVRAQKKHE